MRQCKSSGVKDVFVLKALGMLHEQTGGGHVLGGCRVETMSSSIIQISFAGGVAQSVAFWLDD